MTENKEQQLFFMRWAIQLAQKGRCSAPPNPWVGCLLVKDGQIMAEGYHEAVGKPHAEAIALAKAGVLAKGATAYVSLEPCAHHGKTPPCVDALIAAGVKRVVIALVDPDPLVSGKGIEKLQAAGIEVSVGICSQEAVQCLRPYLHQRRQGRAFCVMKSAASIDGRTAAADGSSRWITGEEARCNVHLLRAESQAIIIGSQTALIDSPRLDVRGLTVARQPLRVLIDSQGKVPPEGPLADLSIAPTLLFTSSSLQKERWEKRGASVILYPSLDLKKVLIDLAERGVIQALIEGGSGLHAAFLKQKLVDRMVIYVGNCLLGDEGRALIPELTVSNISQAPRWTLDTVSRFGDDVRLDFLNLEK